MKTGLCVFVKSKPVMGLGEFLREMGFQEYKKPSPRVLIFTARDNLDEVKFNSIKNEVEKKFQVVVDKFFSNSIYIRPRPDTGEPLTLL